MLEETQARTRVLDINMMGSQVRYSCQNTSHDTVSDRILPVFIVVLSSTE